MAEGRNTENEIPSAPAYRVKGWLAVITLIAAAARLVTLADQPLWMDEFATIFQSRILANEGLVALSGADHVSPFYYFATAVLMKFGASGEFWLRFPSALAGIAAAPMCYLVAKRLFDEHLLGLAAAFIVAISPLVVWYSQDARMYSLFLLFSMLLVYFSWPAVNGRITGRTWLALTACTMLGLYVHHYIALVSISFGLFLLAVNGVRDRQFWGWVSAQALAAASFVPWLWLTWANSTAMSAGVAKPMFSMWIPYTLYTFVSGFSLGPTVAELRMTDPVLVLVANTGVIAVAGIATLVVFYFGIRELLQRNRLATSWCVTWLLAPMIMAVIITFFGTISYNVRYVIGSFPAFSLITAGAVLAAGRRSYPALAAVAALALLTLASLFNWYGNEKFARPDIQNAAVLLREISGEDVVWVASSSVICDFVAYYDLPCPESAISVSASGINLDNAMRELDQYLAVSGQEVILLEYRRWTSDPQGWLRDKIGTSAELIKRDSWGPELTLTRYRVPAPAERE